MVPDQGHYMSFVKLRVHIFTVISSISDPDMDSVRSVDPDPASASGSRSRMAKITNKKR